MSYGKDVREFIDNAENDTAAGLGWIAIALLEVANQIKYLGNGNASTSMGAIEAYSIVVKEALEGIASAIEAHQ